MNVLFLILIFCAVKCDDVSNNYYVIEMPEDEIIRDYKRPFRVYWNVPTMQCQSKKITFENLYEKYGIIQNDGDEFRGEKITILYEPGSFPAIFKNETSGKYRFRNGGVPQEGDLNDHLKVFKEDMEEIVPDPDFSGIGIIDFESWRPIFRQNFGTLVPYKDVSLEIEKKLHWWWPKSWIQTEATQRFEAAARTFMQTTLSMAKQMRPKAIWGYYGFPHCFNMAGQNMKENCSPNVLAENDLTYWMWSESTALYPSVYSSRNLTTNQLGSLVRGRVNEANRIRRYETPVLPYFWFSYREGGYMKEEDLNVVLKSFYKSNASGFIIWGSSSDVNTITKCKNLRTYVETVLGPTIAKYIKKINIANDVIIEAPPELTVDNETIITSDIDMTNKTIVTEIIENSTSTVKKGVIDPEFDWIPPENYSQDISQNVEEELIKKGYNKVDDTKIKTLNDSVVVDMIFDALIKADNYNASEDNKQITRDIQNETSSSNVNNAFITEAPVIRDLDSLNSLITKNPLGFIEKIAAEEAKVEFLDDPITIKESKKDELEGNVATASPIGENLFFEENTKPNYFTRGADTAINDDITNIAGKIDTTTLKNDIFKPDHQKIEQDSVKNTKVNFFIDMFDALLNANYNVEDKNGKEYTKDLQNEIVNPTISSQSTKRKYLTNNDESNILHVETQTEKITLGEFFSNSDAHIEVIKHNKVESHEKTLDTENITEINFSYTTKYTQSTTSSTTEDTSSEKQLDLNEEIEDLIIIANTTDIESSTQYDVNVTLYNNEDNLNILAVNLPDIINQSTGDSELSLNKDMAEESNLRTPYEDPIDLKEKRDDFLMTLANTTDSDVESSTQYDDNVTFGSNDDNLTTSAVNPFINTNQSTSDINLSTNEEATEESNTSSLKEEPIDVNEEIDDDLLAISNTSDIDIESSTQYDDNVTLYNNEDNLIILSVNLSANTNQSTSDNNISDYTTDKSNISTLSDVTVTDSEENEFIIKNNFQAGLNDDENESTTAVDQVVTYIYYP